MKISYNWLKQYVNIDIEPEEVSKMLTACGLEVEALEKYESIKGSLEGVFIGEVKTREKHPDADRLSVTTVDVGGEQLLNIVCGAPNVAAGQKVIVATVGAKLYTANGELEIKKSKIRGQLSEGMICAEDELGVGTSHDGIMVLDSSVKVGTPAKEYFKIETDYVFEIGLTPNRVDASSHIGVARDLIAVINSQFNKNISISLPSIENFKIDNNSLPINIIVEDNDACPRYTGITINNVKVKESPDWLKNKLMAIGQRPINNIVDITNYILHEMGQPLHAFDAAEIAGKSVIIKKLAKGSKFKTLDEVERELNGDELMICNSTEGMCIAGVFGGVHSGVTEKTTSIFLESAYFNPVSIRKTSKYHGLKTDASFRYERGTDPNITIYALKRAALLVKEVAGGEISMDVVDIYPNKIPDFKVSLDYKHMDSLIGKSIERDTVKKILTSLGITIDSENVNGLELTVPAFKVDVNREADVIEEVLRVYGYNNIEMTGRINAALMNAPKPDKDKVINIISDYLSSNGFNEILNNSLTKTEYSTYSEVINPLEYVNILNPLSKELEVMRQTMLFSGLETIIFNINRRNSDLKLYEYGKTYHKLTENNINCLVKNYFETEHIALFVTGENQTELWNNKQSKTDLYYLKTFVNNILQKVGAVNSKLTVKQESNDLFSQCLSYYNGKNCLVSFGLVQKSLLKRFDIKQDVFYADFELANIMTLAAQNKVTYNEIPKFPEVRRDFALLLDKKVTFEEIEKLAFSTEKNLITKVSLFDVYEGDKIEEGKKSYAVSVILQDKLKTLTDNDIEKISNKLIKAFETQLNAKIR